LGEAIERSRSIVFDFDGTLFDIDVDWPGLRETLDEYCPGSDFKRLGMLHGLNALEEREGAGAVQEAFEVVLRFESALPARPRLAIIEHARKAKAEGKALAIFSANCRGTILKTLDDHDLHGVFDAVVGGDDVARRKPDPEGLLKAMMHCKMVPEETLYVADGEREISTAVAAGVRYHILEKVR